MLQRTTSGLYSPSRWTNWRRGLLSGPTSLLLKYVAIAAIVTAIGCLYIWQTNNLRQIYRATSRLSVERIGLEQTNVNLVNQLAQWNTPRYVDERGEVEGYVTPPHSVVTTDEASGSLLAQSAPADAH